MANALDVNGAAKVYIVGRRLEKLQEVASAAVRNHKINAYLNVLACQTNKTSLTNPLSHFVAT